jgi:recombinational DNA repair protein (RecF pathway)
MDPAVAPVCLHCGEPTTPETGGQVVRRGLLCARCLADHPDADPRLAFRSARLRKRAGHVVPPDPRISRPL